MSTAMVTPTNDTSVLLISAPWPNHRMPSIQIAALKAFLANAGIRTVADHFFLRVAHWLGFETYSRIWAPHLEDGEAIYGAMLFPDQLPRVLAATGLAEKQLSTVVDGRDLAIPSRRFFHWFESMHRRALDRFDFDTFRLVGLTLNFGQTLASAYLAHLIKQRAPHVKVVIGGAEATGALGKNLLAEFPQFDFACSGEGERSLLTLARAVSSDRYDGLPPSILSRGRTRLQLAPQVPRIDELPTPDFSEYFDTLSELRHDAVDVCDHLPFETSRGCYYNCSFCSLNLQWEGYRQASAATVGAKVADLRRKHQMTDFFFVDNITPLGVKEFARELGAHGVDYRLFYEARVNLGREDWKALAAAGVRRVQLGVEALSDGLLRLFNKKSTVLHNLQALKFCYEYGIAASGNIIVDHPLATDEHVRESLEAFEYAKAFPPSLSFSYYALLVGSPDHHLGLPGVEVTGNFKLYDRAYPPDVLARIDLPRKSFRRRDGDPADFSPLMRTIEAWEEDHARLQAQLKGHPIVSAWDGGDFLRIEDWRTGERTVFTLDERERRVYLAIGEARHIDAICRETGLEYGWVTGALQAFSEERLAYVGAGRALALALRRPGAAA